MADLHVVEDLGQRQGRDPGQPGGRYEADEQQAAPGGLQAALGPDDAAEVLDVALADYEYEAEAITWSADGSGLVAAPRAGGLQYLSFTPAADEPTTVALEGYDKVAYSLLAVPASATLVVREAVPQGDRFTAGEALLLQLAR